MQTTSAQQWRTCRSYDPAVDLSDKLDEDGQPMFREDVGDDGEVSRQPILVSDTVKFFEGRDPSHLTFHEGHEPAWFVLEPLTIRQLREHVGRADAPEERYLRAFECAIVKIEGWRRTPADEPTTITIARDKRDVVKAKSSELDRLMGEYGLTMADFWEIGAAAYARANVPFGLGGRLQVPRSSLVALGLQRQRHRSAVASAPKSTASEQAKDPPAPTPTTPAA